MTDFMPGLSTNSQPDAPSSPVSLESRIRRTVRDVPDFPSAGILFKDITPVLSDSTLFGDVVSAMAAAQAGRGITHVVGVESRGFIFGAPVALALGVSFVPARKPGKLPWQVEREAYALEYREDVIEMHRDALATSNGAARVLVVDDVLATGGTAAAACRLVERLGGKVIGVSVLMELTFLNGRAAVPHPVDALIAY